MLHCSVNFDSQSRHCGFSGYADAGISRYAYENARQRRARDQTGGSMRTLTPEDVCYPAYTPEERSESEPFDLSSHARAREALEDGMSINDPTFNIFVVGAERSGRMTETLNYLRHFLKDRPVPDDWIYLNNFRRQHRPRPVRLPPGIGRAFRRDMEQTVALMRQGLAQAFGGEGFREQVESAGADLRDEVQSEMQALHARAKEDGLALVQTPQGIMVTPVDDDGKPVGPEAVPEDRREGLEEKANALIQDLAEINKRAVARQGEASKRVIALQREVATRTIEAAITPLKSHYAPYRGLVRWLIAVQEDVLENLHLFQAPPAGVPPAPDQARVETPELRYAVNLLVDHGDETVCEPIVESNPTYENLFGRIEYQSTGGYMQTHFTLIRSGALHRANGSILVLRAEALAANPLSWIFLKGALRDGVIKIEEHYREGGPPLAGSPSPKEIPLSVKVVIVGSPQWYYAFFSIDPEFRAYFKIKADIDPDMPADAHNTAVMAAMIRRFASRNRLAPVAADGISRLLAQTARWAGNRNRLSSRFEQIQDVLIEANQIIASAPDGPDAPTAITAEVVAAAQRRRLRRNARIEDRVHEEIGRKRIIIDTDGRKTGQVNGLTVSDMGDHAFGSVARITARASAGRHGVINIERDVGMSGPIQQKAAMVLQGYLSGRFARTAPISFNCSITFEQNYGGVEGDSASLAEMVAILSDLSGIPVRQDLAITGSVDQHGNAQSIGGAHYKVEGFFRTCEERGLTGNQGVILPASDADTLVLHDEVVAAMRQGRFTIYTVETMEEAAELLTGTPVDDLLKAVAETLDGFDRSLALRGVTGNQWG